MPKRPSEEQSKILSDGIALSAVWTKTSVLDASNRSIAILLHGGPEGDKNGPNNIFSQLATQLALKNIDSVRFDFRGQGESEGDYVDMTMDQQRRDFDAVFSEVKGRGYTNIGIVGESFGATCALGVYSPKNFSTLVLLWPAIYLLDVCYSPFFEEPYQTELKEKGYITVGEDKVGKEFLNEIIRVVNLEQEVRRIASPTLLIHGESDSEVPYTQSVKAHELIEAPKKLVIVPEADHCLRRPHEQRIVLEETTEWLAIYCK